MSPRDYPLPEQACIEVSGPDATAFLHAQLSRTVDTLDAMQAPLAGWHDAKGRLRALVRLVRLPDRWLLLLPRDLAAATASRLRMFVLRAKVQIEPSNEWRSSALLDADASWLAAHALPASTPAEGVVAQDAAYWIRLGPSLWHCVARDAGAAALDGLEHASADDAERAEIELGIPSIGAALVERFVPQMLNLDLLGALSFDKGCYPGQEVIARVHHRGSVKRRMRRYACEAGAVPSPGTEVVGDAGPAGEVVRGARASPTTVELLAVVDHAAAAGALSVAGAALRALPLPYEVPNG